MTQEEDNGVEWEILTMGKEREARNALNEFLRHAQRLHPEDTRRLNVALGILQRLSTYGECSWHPGEYHGICSDAVR